MNSFSQQRQSFIQIQSDEMNSKSVRVNFLHDKEFATLNDEWLGSDKAKHFGVSFLLVVAGKVFAQKGLNFDRNAAITAGAGGTVFIGFLKELVDDQKASNIFSLKDFLADSIGIVLAIIVLQL